MSFRTGSLACPGDQTIGPIPIGCEGVDLVSSLVGWGGGGRGSWAAETNSVPLNSLRFIDLLRSFF